MATTESEDRITIPPEIVTEILYRLPAKSLGRFRCVSKYFLSLISNPHFIKTHQKTLNQNHIILVSHDFSLYSLPFHYHKFISKATKLQFDSNLFDFIYHGSCNGLVLVSAYDFLCTHKLVVLNPTTREFIELPLSGYAIIDDLLEIEIIYGFGYDYVNDDYKVVTVSYFHNHYLLPPVNISVHVYSLRTNTWKRVNDSPYDHFYGMSLSGVFVNGFIHWIAKKGSEVIAAFSLADEKFMELPLPNFHNIVDIMFRNHCKLVVYDEKLAIFLENEGEVWLMNEYGVKESWIKILVNGLDESSMVKPMTLDDNNDKVLLVSRDLVLIYDVEEKTFCKSVGVSRNMKDLKVRGAYVESLVSPKFS